MDATDNGVLVTQYYGCWVVDFYHKSRTHLGLGKDTPDGRPIQPASAGEIVASPEVGGLHHRYERRAAYASRPFAACRIRQRLREYARLVLY